MNHVQAANCKLSSCFQQGFNHPTISSTLVGLIVIAVVLMLIRAVLRKR